MLLLARLLHIVTGVFWAGAIFFNALLLGPAILESGPEGGKVMGALARRGMLVVMPVLGFVTILSGLWLYWIASAGFSPDYMRSRPGMAYGLGMVTAVVALGIGFTVMRPAMNRLPAAEPSEAARLRRRVGAAGRLVALLLAISVVTMAVGRYL